MNHKGDENEIINVTFREEDGGDERSDTLYIYVINKALKMTAWKTFPPSGGCHRSDDNYCSSSPPICIFENKSMLEFYNKNNKNIKKGGDAICENIESSSVESLNVESSFNNTSTTYFIVYCESSSSLEGRQNAILIFKTGEKDSSKSKNVGNEECDHLIGIGGGPISVPSTHYSSQSTDFMSLRVSGRSNVMIRPSDEYEDPTTAFHETKSRQDEIYIWLASALSAGGDVGGITSVLGEGVEDNTGGETCFLRFCKVSVTDESFVDHCRIVPIPVVEWRHVLMDCGVSESEPLVSCDEGEVVEGGTVGLQVTDDECEMQMLDFQSTFERKVFQSRYFSKFTLIKALQVYMKSLNLNAFINASEDIEDIKPSSPLNESHSCNDDTYHKIRVTMLEAINFEVTSSVDEKRSEDQCFVNQVTLTAYSRLYSLILQYHNFYIKKLIDFQIIHPVVHVQKVCQETARHSDDNDSNFLPLLFKRHSHSYVMATNSKFDYFSKYLMTSKIQVPSRDLIHSVSTVLSVYRCDIGMSYENGLNELSKVMQGAVLMNEILSSYLQLNNQQLELHFLNSLLKSNGSNTPDEICREVVENVRLKGRKQTPAHDDAMQSNSVTNSFSYKCQMICDVLSQVSNLAHILNELISEIIMEDEDTEGGGGEDEDINGMNELNEDNISIMSDLSLTSNVSQATTTSKYLSGQNPTFSHSNNLSRLAISLIAKSAESHIENRFRYLCVISCLRHVWVGSGNHLPGGYSENSSEKKLLNLEKDNFSLVEKLNRSMCSTLASLHSTVRMNVKSISHSPHIIEQNNRILQHMRLTSVISTPSALGTDDCNSKSPWKSLLPAVMSRRKLNCVHLMKNIDTLLSQDPLRCVSVLHAFLSSNLTFNSMSSEMREDIQRYSSFTEYTDFIMEALLNTNNGMSLKKNYKNRLNDVKVGVSECQNSLRLPLFLLASLQYESLEVLTNIMIHSQNDSLKATRIMFRGLANLVMDRPDHALDCFLEASRNGFTDGGRNSFDSFLNSRLLCFKPLRCRSTTDVTLNTLLEENELNFNLRILSLFQTFGHPSQLMEMANIALSLPASNQSQNRVTIYYLVFECQLKCGLFESAYNTMVVNPDLSRRKDSLRQLVTTLLREASESRGGNNSINLYSLLVKSFSYVGMESDFEGIVMGKARSTEDILSHHPTCYELMYSYHISRGEFRKAAHVMYEYGMRVAIQLSSKTDRAGRLDMKLEGLRQQLKCYLASLNCLKLLPTDSKYRWLVKPVIRRRAGVVQTKFSPKRDSEGNFKVIEDGGNQSRSKSTSIDKFLDVGIVTIEHIEMEMAICESKLKLAEILTSQSPHAYEIQSQSICDALFSVEDESSSKHSSTSFRTLMSEVLKITSLLISARLYSQTVSLLSRLTLFIGQESSASYNSEILRFILQNLFQCVTQDCVDSCTSLTNILKGERSDISIEEKLVAKAKLEIFRNCFSEGLGSEMIQEVNRNITKTSDMYYAQIVKDGWRFLENLYFEVKSCLKSSQRTDLLVLILRVIGDTTLKSGLRVISASIAHEYRMLNGGDLIRLYHEHGLLEEAVNVVIYLIDQYLDSCGGVPQGSDLGLQSQMLPFHTFDCLCKEVEYHLDDKRYTSQETNADDKNDAPRNHLNKIYKELMEKIDMYSRTVAQETSDHCKWMLSHGATTTTAAYFNESNYLR